MTATTRLPATRLNDYNLNPTMTPKEIVHELDKYIIGQTDAKTKPCERVLARVRTALFWP